MIWPRVVDRAWWRVASIVPGLVLCSALQAAAQNITVTVPGSNTLIVANINNAVVGSTMRVSWSISGNFSGGNHLRISVKADTANFSVPSAGRGPIVATKVSWTIAGAVNGTGTAGTMSSTAFGVVYNSANGKKSGSVDLNMRLAAVGSNVRSGNHQLSLRWKFEAVP